MIGALSSVDSKINSNNSTIKREYAYDSKLRPINEKVTIAGKPYNTRTRYYEDTGFVSSITHPNGYRVSYGYNNAQLEKVIEASSSKLLYAVEEKDAYGRAKTVRYGNNKDEIYAYNRGLLTSVTGSVINLTYDYDTLGNIHTKRDWRMGKGLYGLKETYGYDSMNRLKTVDLDAHGAIGSYNTYEKYTYDKLGNIKTKAYTPKGGSTKTLNYSYNNHRHTQSQM